jgi:predicted nucleic acid-binding protein
VILVDANLLLYAVNQALPQHARSRAWLEDVLSGSEIEYGYTVYSTDNGMRHINPL